MIKLVYCVTRREDLPPDQFRKYWREQHGPLVRSFAEALRARRYVQSHTLDTPLNDQLTQSRGGGEAYDGITEVWWDSMEDLQAGMQSPGGVKAGQALLEDEGKFLDLSRSRLFLTEEHVIFDR